MSSAPQLLTVDDTAFSTEQQPTRNFAKGWRYVGIAFPATLLVSGYALLQRGHFDSVSSHVRQLRGATDDVQSQYYCLNTDGDTTDRGGNTCSWYTGFNIIDCGRYDDDDFTASDMCCMCGGGEQPVCEDTDNGRTGRGGLDCSFFDETHLIDCDRYDDADFTASELCCTCGGGRYVDVNNKALAEEKPGSEGVDVHTEAWCESTDHGKTDRGGRGCWWYTGFQILDCGRYDDDDFTASEMCCNCGGGGHKQVCEDTDHGKTGRGGLDCSFFDETHLIDCDRYDDDDFTASQMCCKCGGGEYHDV